MSTQESRSIEKTIHDVDPARFASGVWSHKLNHQIGEGDISAAYSADTIGQHSRVRNPFTFRGQLWAAVGVSQGAACCYRLVHPSVFDGPATTYAEKTHDGDAARHDPQGFYHGMAIKHGDRNYVLSGPPVHFEPGQIEQPDLFGE